MINGYTSSSNFYNTIGPTQPLKIFKVQLANGSKMQQGERHEMRSDTARTQKGSNISFTYEIGLNPQLHVSDHPTTHAHQEHTTHPA